MTSDELIDYRIYREHRCYVCLELVPLNQGTKWRIYETHRHLYLHAECSRRVRALYKKSEREHLERILPELRAMRPAEELK